MKAVAIFRRVFQPSTVRTRQFPSAVDPESTFREISERLRDPEWKVRQHALRVLVDALPVVEQNSVDRLMVPVVPELVSNLGHPAPAVRKGALDTLRVYLCCSQDIMKIFRKILDNVFNRPDAPNHFQSNISVAVIVGIPSLLFSSTGNFKPPKEMLKFTINALVSRLVQVTHQEAVLKSLARIREKIGVGDFDSNLLDYSTSMKRDFEVLCEVHNINIHKNKNDRLSGHEKDEEVEEIVPFIKKWSSDGNTSGAKNDGRNENDNQDDALVKSIPPSRVVLETEIKFDAETAISMTILEEEKDKKSEVDTESDSVNEGDLSDDVGVVQVLEEMVPEERSFRKRVRFGGEVVKLRTPDSDGEIIGKPEFLRTRIPLPLNPATKMPLDRRRSYSNQTSPHRFKHPKRRLLSSSSKRKVCMHNALLSPKKSILIRGSSPLYVTRQVKPRIDRTSDYHDKATPATDDIQVNLSHLEQIKDSEIPIQNVRTVENAGKVIRRSQERTSNPDDEMKKTKEITQSGTFSQKEGPIIKSFDVKSRDVGVILQSGKIPVRTRTPRKPLNCPSQPSNRLNFDVFPKHERNILMQLSSSGRKTYAETNDLRNEASTNFSRFSQTVTDALFDMNISTPRAKIVALDQFLNYTIDSVQTGTDQTFTGSHATKPQRSSTITQLDWPEVNNIMSTSLQDLQIEESVIPFAVEKSSQKSFGQLKRDLNATWTSSAYNEKSENGVYTVNIVRDKNQSFRELPISDSYAETTPDDSESLTCSSSEGDVEKCSWEELGPVDSESINHVHNKVKVAL